VAKTTQSDASSPSGSELDASGVPKKGHATPTRKEREAARKRPLVGGNTPEARASSKAAMQSQRERARIGMQNGEEKYLPAKDRGPQKRYVRDYVDARYSFGELAIPLLVVLLLASFLGQQAQEILTIALYVYLAVVVIDVIVLGMNLNRKLAAKFGADRVEKVRWYAAMRSIQFKRLRLPKPQVERGEFPK
jgi:hypothetical protein